VSEQQSTEPGAAPLPVPAPARIPVPLRLRRCGEVGRLAARSLVAAPVLAASVVGATSRGCFDWSGRSGSPAVAADPRRRAWPSHTGRPTGRADHLHPGGSALVLAVLTDRWFGRGATAKRRWRTCPGKSSGSVPALPPPQGWLDDWSACPTTTSISGGSCRYTSR
jgi:hypothetical protein